MRPSYKKFLQAAITCVLMVIMLGASDQSSRFNRLGHELVCVCGDNQILLECNHVGCPDSTRMIRELRALMASGSTDTAIFNWFAAKYGPTVLAAPLRGGFDNVAWIVPIAVFLLGTIGAAVLIHYWKNRRTPMTADGVPALTADNTMRDRIRQEINDL